MLALLSALLLLQATPFQSSAAVHALIVDRGRLGDVELARRLEALAAGGDDSAAETLGESEMFGGLGMPPDRAKACRRFERITSRGDSAHNLALCLERGDLGAKDEARARTLYARAAELGWVRAKCALGNMMIDGRGGGVDKLGGLALCREAAEAGDRDAQTDYGGYLLVGEIVPKDAVTARRWLTAAAEQQQANAAFLVGQIHWYGDGTKVDIAEAERWWRVAYAQGRKDAAALIARSLFKRISPDGKTITNRDLIPEWSIWLKTASEEDPDPAMRKLFAESYSTLVPNRP